MDGVRLHCGGSSSGGEGKGGNKGDYQVSGVSSGLLVVDIYGDGQEQFWWGPQSLLAARR